MIKVQRLPGAVVTPALLALFPVLSLFAQNQTDVELLVLWWPLLWCVLGTLALLGVLLLITRRLVLASVLASVIAVGFFYYGVFFAEGSSLSLGLWLLGFAVAALLLMRTKRDLNVVLLLALVAGAVVTLPRAVAIAQWHHSHPSLAATDLRLWPTDLAAPAAVAGSPDIYLLMPDDYARPDVLQQYFHYDDSPFLKQLASRGFAVQNHSRSPYSDSESNMASTLNLDYLTNFPKVLGADSEDVRPVKRVMQDSRAARLLTHAGYDVVHLDTDEVTFAGGNPNISSLAPPDGFPNLWLRKSVLHRVGGSIGFDDAATNRRYRHAVSSVFERLKGQRSGPRPKFVVFHTLLPHDPYVYAADGSARDYAGHTDASFSSESGRAAYVAQLEHLHRQLIDAIDAIRAHATRPPVIILQADEGFQAEPDVFGEAVMKDIRVKGLLAVSLPGASTVTMPDPANTVNTMRVVLNRYLGTTYPMLPSLSHPEGEVPYEFHPFDVR